MTFQVMPIILGRKRYYGEEVEDYEEAMRFTKMIKKVLLFFDTSNHADFVPALRSKGYGRKRYSF